MALPLQGNVEELQGGREWLSAVREAQAFEELHPDWFQHKFGQPVDIAVPTSDDKPAYSTQFSEDSGYGGVMNSAYSHKHFRRLSSVSTNVWTVNKVDAICVEDLSANDFRQDFIAPSEALSAVTVPYSAVTCADRPAEVDGGSSFLSEFLELNRRYEQRLGQDQWGGMETVSHTGQLGELEPRAKRQQLGGMEQLGGVGQLGGMGPFTQVGQLGGMGPFTQVGQPGGVEQEQLGGMEQEQLGGMEQEQLGGMGICAQQEQLVGLGITTQQEQLGGITQQEQPGGVTQQEQPGGVTQQEQLGGITQQGQLGGMTQQEQLGGMTQQGQLGGMTQQEQLGGMTLDEQLGGVTQQEQLGEVTQEEQPWWVGISTLQNRSALDRAQLGTTTAPVSHQDDDQCRDSPLPDPDLDCLSIGSAQSV